MEKSRYNSAMVKIDPDKLLTVAQAAERRGTTRQAINYLIRRGKLASVEIAGRRFIHLKDLESFVPDQGGRPPSKGTKKGSKK
jgi:hypothetical protein